MVPSPPPPPPRLLPSPPPPRPPVAPLSEEELFRLKSLETLNAEHPLGDVFFDYDQHSLGDDARQILQADAAWLSKWPRTAISVEGYCDERGTAEYNLALGQKRAAAVRDYLRDLGVSPSRIRTVSLGEEAPFCHDANETCWSLNRRGHLVVTEK